MSTRSSGQDFIGVPPDQRKPPTDYPTTADGDAEWMRDYLGLELTKPQRQMLDAIHEHQKVIIVAANGLGKTFFLSGLTPCWLFTRYPANVMATSGTYRKLKRTYCKPIESFHKNAIGLPGRYLQNPPRITIDSEPEVFWEAASPADAGELEGVHSEHVLGIVEEADKDAVDEEVLDSMASLLTSDKDRLVVVANPPKDESNVVYDLMENDPTWHVEQFSSFESHNVQIELGNRQGELIEELVTLDQIRQDWQSYNGLEWPGFDEARTSDARDDLDTRWYRRRLGIIPPQAADTARPFTVADVEDAFDREPTQTTATPTGLAWDVARGETTGDYNAVGALFGRDLRILDWWRHSGPHPHIENEETVRGLVQPNWKADFAIDYMGVGSESYDRVSQFYANTVKFNNGAEAYAYLEYANKWTEALCVLGELLRDGVGYTNERLREELLAAARTVELENAYVNKHDVERFEASPKDDVKDRLGRSPDLLDAAAMAAVMAAQAGPGTGHEVPSTW